MKVSIVKQSNNECIVLPNNDVTIIGRGVFGINDKRISKHHGEITVIDNKIKIKSCHKNPIYFKIGNDSKDILYQDAEISLNNNDFFSLLPDDYEFQVKILDEQNESNTLIAPFRVREITEINENLETGAVPVTLSQVLMDIPEDESNPQPQVSSSSTETRKRSTEPETTSELPKRIKTEPQEEEEKEKNIASTSTASNDNPSSSNQSSDVKIKPDPDSSTNQSLSTSTNVKQEPADSSNAKPIATRSSCDHGIRCFRQNAEHRRDYAHPGDNDYRRPDFPPAVPGAPRCPYWAACYRRNPDHFRMFEHPPSSTYDPNQQPPPQHVQAQPPPRRVINVNVYNVYDDNDNLGDDDDEDMFDDFDDTDVDADYEINGETPSEDENNLEE